MLSRWLRHSGQRLFLCSLVAALACHDPTSPEPLDRPSLESAATSTDGSRIAFHSNRDGNDEIYVMNPDGTGQTRLTESPGRDLNPAWSPDGRHIAFESFRDGNSEIYVMNADGSSQSRLTNNASLDTEPDWAPDGDRIAFTSTRDGVRPRIYVMNSNGREQIRVTDNSEYNFQPDWSPDGSRIVFASNRGAFVDIYAINPDGSGEFRLTTDGEGNIEPAWSPDGRHIAFTSFVRAGTGYNIQVMNANGSDRRSLTTEGGSHPAWSPDGGRIAFSGFGVSDVYLMNADGDGSGRTRLTTSLASDQSPAWGPAASAPRVTDGSRIAFTSSRDGFYDIYVMNADGSEETRLTTDPSHDLNPSWSPDGQRIVFQTARHGNSEIYVMNADGSAPTRLTNASSFDQSPTWSPDGLKIVFTSTRGDVSESEIYVMNADGTGQTRLTTGLHRNFDPDWSPDGRQIAFESLRDGSFDIYVMNANGSGEVRLTTDGAEKGEPAWSPDGRRIAFRMLRDGNHNIHLINADGTGSTAQITEADNARHPVWSLDGQLLAFSSSQDGGTADIYLMNADGSGLTRLTTDPANDFRPAWGPAPPETQQEQSIAFAGLPSKTFGDPPFTLSATAASGLQVSFTAAGDCSIAEATVTLLGAGSCTVTAHQPGNDEWLPAADVARTFAIAKAPATIHLTDPFPTFDGTAKAAFAATDPAGLSGLRLTYSQGGPSIPEPVNAGVYQVIASLDNEDYDAPKATGTLTIHQAEPAIHWPAPAPISLGTALSELQLNATATSVGGVALSGTPDYTPDEGTVLPAGAAHPLTVVFDPDDPNFSNATASVTIAVRYRFTGFFRPVDNPAVVNNANGGSAIPVKFSLGGDQGLGIFEAGSPSSGNYTCTTGASEDSIEGTVTANSSGLRYDAAADQYHYVWKTNKAWAGSCRKLVLALNDGTRHEALFHFK